MFGSQALETTIGLVLMFFILATAVSAAVEAIAQATKKRSKDLEAALVKLLKGSPTPTPTATTAATAATPTATAATVTPGWLARFGASFQHPSGKNLPRNFAAALDASAGTAKSSYLSAKAFADLATELLASVEEGSDVEEVRESAKRLRTEMETIATQAKGDLLEVKAGLETWFDEAMAAVQDTYTKWANRMVWIIGAVLVVGLNASAVNVAADLWQQSVTRDAVIAAAEQRVDSDGDGCEKDGLKGVSCTVDQIGSLGLPVGWGSEQRPPGVGSDPATDLRAWAGWVTTHLIGWLLTVLLISLGAPFWFDLLGRLVSLRAAGGRPGTAAEDPTSASSRLARQLVNVGPDNPATRGPGAATPPAAAPAAATSVAATPVAAPPPAAAWAATPGLWVIAGEDASRRSPGGDPKTPSQPDGSNETSRSWLDIALNRSTSLEKVLSAK